VSALAISVKGYVIVELIDRETWKVKKRVENPANLTLNNFLYMVRTVMSSVAANSVKYILGLKTITGETARLAIGNTPVCWDYASLGDFKPRVCIGTGTTPPSNGDYKLENEIACADAAVEDETIGDTEMSFVVTGVIPVESDTEVREVGCKIHCAAEVDVQGTGEFVAMDTDFLIFRDVLDTPITAKAGDKVRVVYKIVITR